MNHIWIDIFLTAFVSLATFLADYVANRLINSAKGIKVITDLMNSQISESQKLEKIEKEIQNQITSQKTAGIMGADLAALAFSLDIAILSIWTINPEFFPFFSRWNSKNTPREIPVWLVLIFSHFSLLLITLILKNYHGKFVESEASNDIFAFLKNNWFKRNRYVIAINLIGFIALLTSLLAITNHV